MLAATLPVPRFPSVPDLLGMCPFDSQTDPVSSGAAPVYKSGDVFAERYQLLSPLAEGGMGSVWKARSLALEVDVAVKVVKRTALSSRAYARLLNEARAAAALVHPSIVRMLDFGFTSEGEPFLVMQMLHGKTLATWLEERGRLPAVTAVQLILPIVDALAEVHAIGMVHRDVKPANILLEEGPRGQLLPKLLDFGIAKQSTVDASLTQSGVLLGSPAYMSPEQARGARDVESPSDVWSLCVTLYEMIAGKRPFEGPNPGAVLFSVFADAPEPTSALGAGDAELWEILRRGLEKVPGERWQSMRAFGRALAVWASSHGVTSDAAGTSIVAHWLGRRSARGMNLGKALLEGSSEVSSEVTAGDAGEVSRARSSASVESATQVPAATRPLVRRGPARLALSAVVIMAAVFTFLALAPGQARTAEMARGLTSPAALSGTASQSAAGSDGSVSVVAAADLVGKGRVALDAPAASAPARGREHVSSPRASAPVAATSRPRLSLPLPATADF